MKRILALCLALWISFGISTTCFAVAMQETEVKDSMPKVARENNYGNVWLTKASSSYFTVYTNYSGTLRFTFKVEDADGASFAYITPADPNDNYLVSESRYIDRNSGEVKMTFYGCPSGSYKIHYMAYPSSGMRIMCWIYQ